MIPQRLPPEVAALPVAEVLASPDTDLTVIIPLLIMTGLRANQVLPFSFIMFIAAGLPLADDPLAAAQLGAGFAADPSDLAAGNRLEVDLEIDRCAVVVVTQERHIR